MTKTITDLAATDTAPDDIAIGAGNRLISLLNADDHKRLSSHLEPVALSLRFVMETPDEPIEYAYFLETGIGSVVAVGTKGNRVEAGLFGREGMSALAVVLGTDRSPHETMMQLAGTGHRVAVGPLRAAIAESPTMRALFLNYAYALSIQTAHTALSNGRQTLEGRLARWLLMCFDRIDGEEISLTHDYISIMLGVRRPGVTLALHALEADGLIKASRSKIIVLDREGLDLLADGFYGRPEMEYRRLVG